MDGAQPVSFIIYPCVKLGAPFLDDSAQLPYFK
jgi:hypothetical protein